MRLPLYRDPGVIVATVFAVIVLATHATHVFSQQSPAPTKVPETQAAQLKKLDEWISTRVSEYQTQRLIVTQRVCLELKMDAKQCDAVDLVEENGVYVVKPKSTKESPKP